ncbi:MAG: hypothetical protein R3B57_07500 [Phycisphaerales bacterium]
MNARRLSAPVCVRRAHRRAALLLEAMLALALLVAASSLLVSIIRDATGRLDHALGMSEAADLAEGAIAQIEGGLATPETLTGPAQAWDPEAVLASDDAALAPIDSDDLPLMGGAPALDTAWRLEIETQPTPFDGLTLVSVTATRDGRPRDTFTFHQLVRLEAAPDDKVGDEDELVETIRRSEEETARREESSP